MLRSWLGLSTGAIIYVLGIKEEAESFAARPEICALISNFFYTCTLLQLFLLVYDLQWCIRRQCHHFLGPTAWQ
ncbi:hypothetical protein F4778DRAFT_502102 [Xylariomycetidae sp. FL2044]|nr:hypothetical protein F4778DRAFT_502102 [Xylariomycetidae sp. FL2044]